jgi:hypothetical protein
MGAAIEEMLSELGDSTLTKTVREWLRQNPDGLVEASQKLQARVEVARASKLEEKAFTPGPTTQGQPAGVIATMGTGPQNPNGS